MSKGSMLIPSLRYKDAHAAIAWLERALGMRVHALHVGKGGGVDHAELTLGTGMVMLGSASNASPLKPLYAMPEEIGGRVTSPVYVVVPDCEPVWASAQAAGADIVMELREMEYGGKAFTARDPEGYLWSVGEYDPWKAVETATGEQSGYE